MQVGAEVQSKAKLRQAPADETNTETIGEATKQQLRRTTEYTQTHPEKSPPHTLVGKARKNAETQNDDRAYVLLSHVGPPGDDCVLANATSEASHL